MFEVEQTFPMVKSRNHTQHVHAEIVDQQKWKYRKNREVENDRVQYCEILQNVQKTYCTE